MLQWVLKCTSSCNAMASKDAQNFPLLQLGDEDCSSGQLLQVIKRHGHDGWLGHVDFLTLQGGQDSITELHVLLDIHGTDPLNVCLALISYKSKLLELFLVPAIHCEHGLEDAMPRFARLQLLGGRILFSSSTT